jgi:hypothetical protein
MKRSSCSQRGLLALALGQCLVTGCGEGREVKMGALDLPVLAPASGAGRCGTEACSDHHGSKVFLDPSAADASSGVFDAGAERAPGTDPSAEPRLLYPSDETRLPVNLSRVRFAWTAGTSSLFALDFTGPNTSVRVVTRETSFLPNREQWAWIAESNRGDALAVTVRAVETTMPLDVWRSQTIALSVSESPISGAIFYWSTGSQGLMRARFDEPNPIKVFTPPSGADAATCTGCHAISRDGTRLAAVFDKNQLGEFSLRDGATLLPPGSVGVAPQPDAPDAPMTPDGGPPPPPEMMPKPDKAPPAVWSTFSPDGKLLLVAGGGKLRLVDADTGAPIGADQGAVRLPAGAQATHPDWSPLGDRVAVTLATKGGDKQTEGGSIALLAYADHAFGEPTILIPSASDKDNNFFPSFSPDGRLIAYVNATGGSQEATSARLRLVDVASASVRELVRLNERVGPDDGVVNLGNTMPTWAPSTEPGQFWLAFSSLRAYAELRPQDPKQDQLWIAGIDPALDDPGLAAFWAPFQSLAQGNHRAVWTPAPLDAACGCVERCANGTDDDCDGRLDEDDCVTACADREICGDGIDNDCDCVVDDCSQEICDDGIDNDGDGKSDKMDVACP